MLVSSWPLGQTHFVTSPDQPGRFVTTRWSVVLAAGESGAESLAALETLCQACWPPVYGYIRRLGKDPEESRDLTQAFFAHVLASGALAGARPERGRFRYYLLGALKHFLADAHDYALAWKRGGGREVVSLDALKSEESYGWEPADHRSPDQVFERRWALALMLRALNRLEEECRLSGKDGELVRAEVSETLGEQADLDDELRHLLRLLRGE